MKQQSKIAQLKLNKAMSLPNDTAINISSIMESLNIKIEKEENAAAINETFFRNNVCENTNFSLDTQPSDEMKKKAENYLN